MRHEEFQSHLSKLIGAMVFNKFIVCNSIVLWIDAPAKTSHAKCLWIDPPWRIESESSILTTSASFPHEQDEGESEEAYKARFTTVCTASDIIESSFISDIFLDPRTSDLSITFDNGYSLLTFTVWTDEDNWSLSDYQTNQLFTVAANETLVSQLDA